MTDADQPVSPGPTVAQVFDSLAGTYDQTGVSFFRPVGERLVTLVGPAPGDNALDLGCGRGAATVPLALAVGAQGSVTAMDLAPAMAAATRSVTQDLSLDNVTVAVGDVSDRDVLGDGPYDVITASLVLFFVADPATTLASWVSLLAPGGRIGLTTFGPLDGATGALDDLLAPHQPAALLDARTSGMSGPFASDAGMEDLFRAAGAADVRTVVEPAVLEFADVAEWHRFSMSTGQRAMWANVPEEEKPGVLAAAAEVLERTRQDGRCRLVWQMRYTLGSGSVTG